MKLSIGVIGSGVWLSKYSASAKIREIAKSASKPHQRRSAISAENPPLIGPSAIGSRKRVASRRRLAASAWQLENQLAKASIGEIRKWRLPGPSTAAAPHGIIYRHNRRNENRP